MTLLKALLLENDLKSGASAILTFLVFFVGLLLTKKWLLRKIEPRSEGDRHRWDSFLARLLKGTKTLFLFCWAAFSGLSFVYLPPPLENGADKVLFLVTMVQLAIWGGSSISFWMDRHIQAKSYDATGTTALGLMNSLSRFLFYSLLLLLSLKNFGVDISALLAGLGVGGIAVALAVRNILGDLLASLTIVLDKPFVIGDLVHVGDYAGTIEKIGLKTTRIRSLSGEQLIFPNADLLQSRLKNFKRMSERRIVFPIHVVLQTPYPELRKIPRIFRTSIEIQPLARFERATLKSIGTFSLEFELVYWVRDQDYNTYMSVHHSINMELIRHFRQERIEFAHPTQTVYVHPKAGVQDLSVAPEVHGLFKGTVQEV